MEGDHCDRDSQEDPALITGYDTHTMLLEKDLNLIFEHIVEMEWAIDE